MHRLSQQSRLLKAWYIGHGTVLINIGGLRLLTDPILRDRVGLLCRRARAPEHKSLGPIDAVLLSHAHVDHLDPLSLRLLPRDTPVLLPVGAARRVRRLGFWKVLELEVGQSCAFGSVEVRAVPAVHRRGRGLRSAGAECVGYLIQGPLSLYFAGDTCLFPEMASISSSLDVAFLPVWGWGPRLGPGHLTPQDAARSLTLLKPRVAVPIHWGALCPLGLGWMRPSFLLEPPREFASHASRMAPDVAVRVLPPGSVLVM